MPNNPRKLKIGYVCTVRGCKDPVRFQSPFGLARHIMDKHGKDELANRLRTYKKGRRNP